MLNQLNGQLGLFVSSIFLLKFSVHISMRIDIYNLQHTPAEWISAQIQLFLTHITSNKLGTFFIKHFWFLCKLPPVGRSSQSPDITWASVRKFRPHSGQVSVVLNEANISTFRRNSSRKSFHLISKQIGEFGSVFLDNCLLRSKIISLSGICSFKAKVDSSGGNFNYPQIDSNFKIESVHEKKKKSCRIVTDFLHSYRQDWRSQKTAKLTVGTMYLNATDLRKDRATASEKATFYRMKYWSR